MKVRYLDFGRYHGKKDVPGSTMIRMKAMESFWDDFGRYKYGEKADVMIFQKVYCTEDYKLPVHYPAFKILDICDPDWLDGSLVAETCRAVDAVTCPTEELATFLRQFTDNVFVIPDRFDVTNLPAPKIHTKQNPIKVVWFGYAHNAELLKPALKAIDDLGLELTIIANEQPYLHRFDSQKDAKYKFVKYDEITIMAELQKCDIALLPEGNRPVDRFKSNNKTIKANLAGLPVAKTKDELIQFMDARNRNDWVKRNYDKIKVEYDIRHSVKQYQEIISNLGKLG